MSSIVRDEASVYIFAVFGIFLTVLGTVGNVTSITVLSRSNMRRLKIRPYLIALAVFDLLCLYIILLPAVARFVKGLQGKQGPPRTALQCKVMLFSGFFILDCSSWMTVAISIERLLYIVCPFMVRPEKGTTIALSLVIGLVALINIPIANGWTVVDGKCHVAGVYFLIHFTISSYIPAFIMVVSNIIIANTLCRRPKLASGASNHNNSIRMAVGINVIFLCTTFPVSIVWAIVDKLYLPLFVLLYANNAVNFASYIIAGETFRKELKAMLYGGFVCCQKSVKNSPSLAQTSETVSTAATSV